ncbi:MAG: Polyphosphate kinase 2 [Chthoniobacteraceae bacterium]|nr:Polyphosphate kinase 2 [Chthoniobacteraceae bacterium]
MKANKVIRHASKFSKPYRVVNGRKFHLKDFDPKETGDLRSEDKPCAKEALEDGITALATLQEVLYAQNRWSVLVIFQAMDAAGKDGAIKHVMSGINPQGCQVSVYKAPSDEELDHDYLWRCVRNLPERGRIGIFNRSYYEETLAVRVHPDFLERQKLPESEVNKQIWKQRHGQIRDFERYLRENGTIVLKFFLHVSKGEQKKRLLERLNNAEKHWKFDPRDLVERGFWDDYMKAYEETICATATKDAPWYVVPADNKWYTRVVVASAIIDAIDSLDLEYPQLDSKQREALSKARKALAAEN